MTGPTVQLEWAFSWRCPRCRRQVYGEFPAPPLPLEELREEEVDLEEEIPSWLPGSDEENTFFMVVPGSVRCFSCGVEFEVKLPRGMDPIEGMDDDGI